MHSMYLQQLMKLTQKYGSLPEQQLIGRWQAELDRFLKPVDRNLLNNTTGLEFGIEDSLSLKIILKSKGTGPVPALLALMNECPTLAPWGAYILKHQLRFHCGIKLTPDRLTRELYAYPRDYAQLEAVIGNNPFLDAVKEIRPLGIGIDDHRGYSMYYDATDVAWVETLRNELGIADWEGVKLWAWQQLRYDGTQLLPGKTALELTPLPAKILARFASHYPFPYFKYLIPLKQNANGNFGRDPVSGRFALYATVNQSIRHNIHQRIGVNPDAG